MYRSESKAASGSGAYGKTEQVDGKTYMKLNVRSEAEGSKQQTQISGLAHETGHGWRMQHGLETDYPAATGSIESFVDETAKASEINEKGASHIENIVKSELIRSGNPEFGQTSLRAEYSGGLISVPKRGLDGKFHQTIGLGIYKTLEPPRDANYYNQQIDIHKEHGVQPIK